ncbi:MFS transporter [Cnuibacter physcomitrellae]|uniref:MFS transporter n=1 Tax=Cnuibacter physcomitrellae TaxID=1619308 RepID=A0A1X9LMQ9_9MICO|nr:MFS transporter [Cnuibacter physcomitrellae]ARJ05568.1 MFS transporter [Cnuibacter physcomitrellae]GGI35978.1 MFS transporter [Cnuibacter physcomitrellae]
MSETARRRAGGVLALVGIVVLALNLRTSVAALSPVVDEVGADIPLSAAGLGILGMLPPLCFAAFGLLTPPLQRRLGIEALLVVALAAIGLGDVVRGLATSYPVLLLGSVITFAGMGVANVLLPPLTKKYFPERIGLMTSVYATALAIGATVPPLVAVPVADAAGWRFELSIWGVLAVATMIPWILLLVREGRRARATDPEADVPERAWNGRVHRSVVAWSLLAMFAATGFNAYAMFAWMPEVLTDVAGVTDQQAGALLSLFAVMGLPAALLVPVLAARMRSVLPLILTGSGFYVAGYLGLLLAPSSAIWLWVALIGLGPLLFPLSLALISLRTRTHEGAVALSAFVQGGGYALSALGPLLVGVLHEATGAWTVPLVVLGAVGASSAIVGVVVSRPVLLEDERRR